ncbi:MAG: phosphonate metabolism protein/1,5-bisphosphokinase (PRPP-forming) PhnN [Pseudomonadota bacterium]
MIGRLIAVVGPSGAGKDTILSAARPYLPSALFARRAITRPSAPETEDFDAVSEAAFLQREAEGGFAITWQAHGLHYGIPVEIDRALDEGRMVIFNGSRKALPGVRQRYPDMGVVAITASPEVLAARLAARGRESADEIADRLARADLAMPAEAAVVINDTTPADGVAQFLATLNRSAQSG